MPRDPDVLRRARRYVRKIQPKMRLADWEIEVSDEPAESHDHVDSYAVIFLMNDKREAVIYLGRAFYECPNWRRAQALIHELTHCHLTGMADATKQMVRHCSPDVETSLREWYRVEEEYAVDQMSKILWSSFPKFPKAVSRGKQEAERQPAAGLPPGSAEVRQGSRKNS